MSAVTVPTQTSGPRPGFLSQLNSTYHERALWVFMTIVTLHWAEHLVQAWQVWIVDMPRPQARGVLGYWFPVLASSEILHFGYAISMLTLLVLLRPGFSGAALKWWTASLLIQTWHFVEHAVLQYQAAANSQFFGGAKPTSILQPLVPRVELHLLYNFAVFVPMAVAMFLHTRPGRHDDACSCSLKSAEG